MDNSFQDIKAIREVLSTAYGLVKCKVLDAGFSAREATRRLKKLAEYRFSINHLKRMLYVSYPTHKVRLKHMSAGGYLNYEVPYGTLDSLNIWTQHAKTTPKVVEWPAPAQNFYKSANIIASRPVKANIQSCVHCELVVAQTLLRDWKRYTATRLAIGCSKPSCYLCTEYLSHLNVQQPREKKFVLRGTHGKRVPGWIPPNEEDAYLNEPAMHVRKLVGGKIKEVYEVIELRRKSDSIARIGSTESAKAEGSGGPEEGKTSGSLFKKFLQKKK